MSNCQNITSSPLHIGGYDISPIHQYFWREASSRLAPQRLILSVRRRPHLDVVARRPRPRSALRPHHHGAARPTLSPCAPPRSFFFGSPAPPPRTAARRRRGSRCSSKAPRSSRGSSRNSWRCHSSACAQRSSHPETSLCHPWRSFGVHIGVAQGTPEQEGEWGRRCAVPSRPCSSSHAAECTS